jgi:hypothetical protein
MRKTGSEIEQDVFDIIVSGSLSKEIKGDVYKEGTRPKDPTSEDAVVSFHTGLDGQFQTGTVNVNIYVPNTDNGSGVLVKDTARCEYLERKADEVVRSLKPTDYHFSLGGIIQTFKLEDIEEYFVNVKLKFELKTF